MHNSKIGSESSLLKQCKGGSKTGRRVDGDFKDGFDFDLLISELPVW